MRVLGILSNERKVSGSSRTQLTLLILLMISFGRLIGDLGVRAAELEHPNQESYATEGNFGIQAAPSITTHLASIETPHDKAQSTREPNGPDIQFQQTAKQKPILELEETAAPASSPHTPLTKGHTAPQTQPSSFKIPSRPDKASSPASPRSSRQSPRNFRHFKVNRSTLPRSVPKIETARVNLEPTAAAMSPPNAMFVPHTHQRRARLLIRNLQNISSEVRTHEAFYDVTSPLKYHRRVPRADAIAWRQKSKPQFSPKGKPANGFVFISSVFGKRPNPFGRGTEFHNGIDLVGAKGIPILATAEGRVVSRSRGRGYGIHVVVDHGTGYETLYAHLSKKRVKKNQRVKRGQIIGYLGSTGRSTGPHLHYSVYLNRQAVDPRPYLFK